MSKEKRCAPTTCEGVASEINSRLDYLYQRHAALLRRMDDVERVTRERHEQLSSGVNEQTADLVEQQRNLLRMAREQEEESARIFANQNDLLLSLQSSLEEIHEKLRQLSERHEALLRRSARTPGSA